MAGSDDEQGSPVEGDPGDASQPLPPIPDGGLATAMPSWLRSPLVRTGATGEPGPPQVDNGPGRVPGPSADVASLVEPEDLPAWLRSLVEPTGLGVSTSAGTVASRAVTVDDVFARYARNRPIEGGLVSPPATGETPLTHVAVEAATDVAAPIVSPVIVSAPPATRRVFLLVAITLAMLLVLLALATVL